MIRKTLGLLFLFFTVFPPLPLWSSSGTEGAAFLDIPVGAGPAALGGAYSALANDAYAPTINPAGLGFLESTQLAGQHLSYLESIHYEYASFVHTLQPGHSLGGSIQYLGSGDIAGTDINGTPIGDFSSHYTSFNLAYGQAVNEKVSAGITGKVIQAAISDVSASAFAVDVGGMYRANSRLMLAGVLTNAGSKLTFINQGDSLPLAFKAGAAYQVMNNWQISAEGVYRKTGLASLHVGTEWRPLSVLAIRAGYRTDTTKELGPMAGLTAGVGIDVWGHELSYAWLPFGDLGSTHYFSIVLRFGEEERAKRNLIQYHTIKRHRIAKEAEEPEYEQLMQLLSDRDKELVTRTVESNEGTLK